MRSARRRARFAPTLPSPLGTLGEGEPIDGAELVGLAALDGLALDGPELVGLAVEGAERRGAPSWRGAEGVPREGRGEHHSAFDQKHAGAFGVFAELAGLVAGALEVDGRGADRRRPRGRGACLGARSPPAPRRLDCACEPIGAALRSLSRRTRSPGWSGRHERRQERAVASMLVAPRVRSDG